MTVAIFSQNKFSSVDEMKSLMNNDEISKQVQGQKAMYYQIDIVKTMADLTQIGQLLKLAYAGTKKMKSNKFSVQNLTRYQRLIKDSMVTTGSFVEGSIKVLKWHKLALSLTEKKTYAMALKFLEKASTIPGEMAQISGDRVKQAEELSNLAEEACVAVNLAEKAIVAVIKNEHMDAAAAALGIAWTTLDKVCNTFENVRIFWNGVEKHTKALKGVYEDAALFAEVDAKEELIGVIYDSAIGWLTFALTSQTALEAIQPAVKEVDAVLNDIPNDAEAANLLANGTAAALLQNIEQDNKVLKSLSAQSAVANK